MADSPFRLYCQLSENLSQLPEFRGLSFIDSLRTARQEEAQRRLVRRNRRRLFSLVLRKSVVPARKMVCEMPLQDQISASANKLEQRGLTVEARKLEQCHERLSSQDGRDVWEAVLSLLLQLQDTGKHEEPSGLLSMGDCLMERPCSSSSRYSEFPSQLFQPPCSPPTQTIYRTFPAVAWRWKEEAGRPLYSLSLQPSLGLDSPSKAENVDSVTAGDVSESDDGYSSGAGELGTEIWDRIWEVEVSSRRTWERLGCNIPPVELPFMSEAGPEALARLRSSTLEQLELVEPGLKLARPAVVSLNSLSADLGYLLAGIPSTTFTLSHRDRFSVAPGRCLPGLSPECLASFCQQFLQAGTAALRLQQFSSQQIERGSIVQGFRTGLCSFLRSYCDAVITISLKFCSSLGQFEQAVSPLVKQVTFLARLCKLNTPDDHLEAVESEEQQLPGGVFLLSKLLNVSVHISEKTNHLLLVSLLSAAAKPYFKFLKCWLFSGDVEGDVSEFGLQVNHRFIFARDRSYWTGAFDLIPIEGSSFLSDIQQQVHLAGKSLALLRLISPDHFLAGRFRTKQPEIRLAVSAAEQLELKEVCRKYEEEMLLVASKHITTFTQYKEKEEEERMKKLDLIQSRNEQNRLKNEKDLAERKEEKLNKQKKHYEDIQNQIKEVNDRKLKEKLQKEAEDKKIEDEWKKIEEVQKKKEEEERQRLEEFYSKLMADAELREKKADWKLRRADPSLGAKRIAFHNEMNKNIASLVKQKKALLDESAESLDDSRLKIKNENDDRETMVMLMEDHEGNVKSEKYEGFNDLTEDVHQQIRNESKNLESPPMKQVSSTSSLNSFGSQPAWKENCARVAIKSRAENKAFMVGTTTEMFEDAGWRDVRMEQQEEEDVVDGRNRKRKESQDIERLLYPGRYLAAGQPTAVSAPAPTPFSLTYSSHTPQPYQKSFPALHAGARLLELGGTTPAPPPADGQAFAPLTLILQNSVLIPLRSQARLVDSALMSQFLVGEKLVLHLAALRRYLLLADGEFGRQLVVSLCQLDRQPDSPKAKSLHHPFSPAALNRVLETALAGSVCGANDPFAANIAFLLEPAGSAGRTRGLPGLSLTYRAQWPVNIVLTPEAVSKYSAILDFMLELRLAMVSLERDWANENLVLRGEKKTANSILHRVNLMRHEMINFLSNLHAYISCQVLEITWLEFQENLANKVTCLDNLIEVHEKFISKAVFRCLLNPKAAPVMKLLTDIFSAIAQFSSLAEVRLTSDCSAAGWERIEQQYRVFQQYSRYFFSVVTKLSARGYQPHLQDLLLRLNFNGFYNKP